MKFLLLYLTLILTFCGITFGQNGQYSKLLKNQGYTAMKTPRTAFGTGTIIGKLGKNKDEPLATPEQCFPDLKSFITLNELVLPNSNQEKSLGINAGANFVPGGKGILGSLIGAFGFKKDAKLDVTFGKTTAYEWTPVAFENYLAGKTISAPCFRRLTDPNNLLIISTAQVDSMTYTFNGTKKSDVNVTAQMLNEKLKANGGFNYSNITKNSFTINSPMFIAYKAYSFENLGIPKPKGKAGVYIAKDKFKLKEYNPDQEN